MFKHLGRSPAPVVTDESCSSAARRPQATKDQLAEEFGVARVTVMVLMNASHELPLENPGAAAIASDAKIFGRCRRSSEKLLASGGK